MPPIPESKHWPDASQFTVLAYEDPRFNGCSWTATCLDVYVDEMGPTCDAAVRKMIDRVQREIADTLAEKISPTSAPEEYWRAAMEVPAIPFPVSDIRNTKGQPVTLTIHTISFDRFRRLHETVFGATHFVPIPDLPPGTRIPQMYEDIQRQTIDGNDPGKSSTPGGRVGKELRLD